MKTNENVRKWTKKGKKRTKTYESVKTSLKMDENVQKMDENERKKYENGRKCMKTDENI